MSVKQISWKTLVAADAYQYGAHESHDVHATGDATEPLIFCRRCAGFVGSGSMANSKLALPCPKKPRLGRWPAHELRLLEAGVRPAPGARLPPADRGAKARCAE